jgi:excisionase family DNA binding protein
MTDMRKLLRVTQAAARLGVTPPTIRAWVANGTLPAARPGRSIYVLTSGVEAIERGDLPVVAPARGAASVAGT